MVKYIYTSILILALLGGVLWYWNYDETYYRVCESPQKHKNFKELSLEEQYQTYLKYKCNYDSVSARFYWGFYIGEKENSIDFLLEKLRSENDEDILRDTLYILSGAVSQQEIKGREEIVNLVKQTIDKIPDKDERDLIGKVLGSEVVSRKERLFKISQEIEERTKMTKEEYQNQQIKIVDEKIERLIKEVTNTAREVKEKENNASDLR